MEHHKGTSGVCPDRYDFAVLVAKRLQIGLFRSTAEHLRETEGLEAAG
jgi:hypothetical protein